MSNQLKPTTGTSARFRILALLLALVSVSAACGGDEDAAEEESTPAEDSSADDGATSDEEDGEVSDQEDAGAEDDAGADDDEAAVGEGLPVERGEWDIDVDGVTAGEVTFAVSNAGENPHALAIAKGSAYEDLPLQDNGAVVTDELGDDFLGTTENIESGESGSITFELEAGDYVFFCPIEFGPNSHAGNGQVLAVTVS